MKGVQSQSILLLLLGLATLSCNNKIDEQHLISSKMQNTSSQKGAEIMQPTLPGISDPSRPLDQTLEKALQQKGGDYKPRTHHLHADGSPKFTNRLIQESSPYLLQHAHNPVNWFSWNNKAFDVAKRLNRPVFVSIGYSTCHWCHVMEKESFEDIEIARFINANFIPIKVDREERPDIDDIYMAAVQMMTGHGGWPMTVVMTPEKKPFFGGTYFPPRDGARGSRMGFLSILKELCRLYQNEQEKILEQADKISQRIEQLSLQTSLAQTLEPEVLVKAAQSLEHNFDPQWGGFGRAPKFPQPSRLSFLLRYYRRTQDPKAIEMVSTTLTKMAQGGMYDQIGGGFHRYSVDSKWLVPHFEKMLYDNAQLVSVYLEAWQITRNDFFKTIASETLNYVAREMTAPESGFYSATDADSPTPDGHEEEGWFFTWTPNEIQKLLSEQEANVVESYFSVTGQGNFEGRNIFHTPEHKNKVAQTLRLETQKFESLLRSAVEKLYVHRKTRQAPLRDDKILAAWNGLMISAFAKGSLILGNENYKHKAVNALHFIFNHMMNQNTLSRSYICGPEQNTGIAKHKGYLDDYAMVIQACLDVFEIDPQPHWLEKAFSLQQKLDTHFWDAKANAYFMTSDEHEALLFRDKPSYDGAVPSGNSVAALNLLRLAQITEKNTYQEKAEQIFAVFSETLRNHPTALSWMLTALDFYFDSPFEIILVTPQTQNSNEALFEIFQQTFVPNRLFLNLSVNQTQELSKMIPLLKGKLPLHERTTAFVCEKANCKLPTQNAIEFAKQISQFKPLIKSKTPAPSL